VRGDLSRLSEFRSLIPLFPAPKLRAGLLLSFARARQAELDSTVFIGLDRGWNIEYGEGKLFDALRRKVPQQPVNDRIVMDLTLMLIAKYEHRCGIILSTLVRARTRLIGT